MKGETFFNNWVNSNILYLKDILDKNSTMLFTVLKGKSNWFCEYKTLCSVIKPLCKKYDISNFKYLNIKNEMITQ